MARPEPTDPAAATRHKVSAPGPDLALLRQVSFFGPLPFAVAEELRQLGAGDSFGEIALLRQVPRTATVIAVTRLAVRTLARDEFLAAVTGNAASAEGADEVISGRLQAGGPKDTAPA